METTILSDEDEIFNIVFDRIKTKKDSLVVRGKPKFCNSGLEGWLKVEAVASLV